MEEYRWYVVKTFAGHENKVKNLVDAGIAESEDLQRKISRTLVPVEKVYEIKDGKKRCKMKKFLPGYLLIQADVDLQVKDFILNTSSVMGFLGPDKNTPIPLMPDEVKRILSKIDDAAVTEKVDSLFKVGDVVKINEGPFQNFSGTVQEVSEDKMKMKVMVSIFGRKTPVEIDFVQAEFEK